MASSWAHDVQRAFPADLAARINDVAKRYQGDELPTLFGDIAKHILSPGAHPASKKRKLEVSNQGAPQNGSNGIIANPTVSFECKNVSFAVPARKKLKLQLVTDGANAKEIRVLNPQTNDVEYSIAHSQIEQAFCLPVPEKQQRQWNFVIFPQAGATNAEGMPCEQMVFTMNETKPDDASSSSRAVEEGDTYVSVTEPELNHLLQPLGKRVIRPIEDEFSSSIPQSHRKGEKAYHVKAHRGTKEGFLFFLSNGIVFGFKKPLSFFPFAVIESISYTSVLQRTFNLVITSANGEDESHDTEFSMLDQSDFAGIDEYVKRHGLNDASLAANRRAKAYNVNKTKAEANGEGGDENGGEGGDPSELARAEEQALQDAEDEEEEDYEDSGGESEGEYSEEDEEGE